MKLLDSLFPKKEKKPAKPKEAKASSPYLDAQRSLSERSGEMFNKIKAWQLFALMEFAVILGVLAVLAVNIQSPKYIPYVVELDKLGVVVSSKPANAQFKATEQIIKSTVSDFVFNLRTVTADISLQNEAIRRVFAHLTSNDPARRVVTEWYQMSPFDKAREMLVSVSVNSVLRQSESTWQVEWVETARNHNGDRLSTTTYRALLTVYQSPVEADTAEMMSLNPLSIFVRDVSWTKVN